MFKGEYVIKTVEKEIDIKQTQESIPLISRQLIAEHINDYKYLHIGSIQIAIKSLFRQGIDTPLFAVLRDNRPTQLSDQILAIFETNLHEGPVYINNYPNYSVSLKSFHETNYNVFLDIKMKEDDWNPMAIPITIIYRLYYKVMKTQLAPQALLISPKDETTLLLVNSERVNASVPRVLRHDEITSGLKWRLEDILPPTPPTPSEVDAITEFRNGTVEITFTPLRDNLRRVRSMARSEFSSARPSIDRRSFSIPRGLVMQGLRPDHTTPTPEFEPEETQYTSAQSHQSPTRSDLSQLNVISSFEINKKLLQANFVSEINKKRKDWFYKNFDIEERSKIREEYYKYMNTRQENVFFFEWFEHEYLKTIQVIKNGEKL